ncbi:MAG TPA: hypothetical protein VLB50_13820 [Ignavibacteriaceae bacterium]|nr:hypothetical protein [Ignavibacteriaceae bacterium]
MIIASIDIGSNTMLLLIVKINLQTGNIIKLKDELRLSRISKGLIPGGKITHQSEKRLFEVLHEYFEIIKTYGCNTVLISGTNAFRIASNTDEITARIKDEFNAELKVLTGDEEAELAYLGTEDYGNKNETKLVIDIGGGSTELIYGKDQIFFLKSFNAGVVHLSENFLKNDRPAVSELKAINDYLEEILGVLPKLLYAPDITLALAGTPVTLSCILNRLYNYDETMVEGYILNYYNVQFLYEHLSNLSPREILKLYKGIVLGREDLILSGTSILLYIMKLLKIEKVIVSTKGIRYGAIRRYLSKLT